MQPTPILSLGSDIHSWNLSSQPPPTQVDEQKSPSGWCMLVGTYPLCRNLSALPSAPLLLCSPPWLWSFPPPIPHLHLRMGFIVCGKFSSFTAPSQRCRSHPYSFVSVFCFFFWLTQVRGEFLSFWEVWGLLPAFSRASVGVVPHVDVSLLYFWEVHDLHVLLLCHLEGPSDHMIFIHHFVGFVYDIDCFVDVKSSLHHWNKSHCRVWSRVPYAI